MKNEIVAKFDLLNKLISFAIVAFSEGQMIDLMPLFHTLKGIYQNSEQGKILLEQAITKWVTLLKQIPKRPDVL